MDNKFLYVMAHFDDKTENILRELQYSIFSQGIVGKQTSNFPSHITLGTYEIDEEVELKDKIISISKKVNKIPVSFDSIGLFGMNVLFIAPSVSYDLLDLHKEFDNNCSTSFNWVPHVTMLHDELENIQKSLTILTNKFTPFSGFIESISLYEFFPSRFIVEETLLDREEYEI